MTTQETFIIAILSLVWTSVVLARDPVILVHLSSVSRASKQPYYTAHISEDAPIGTSLVKLQVYDPELVIHGGVRYSFSEGKDAGGSFFIDPSSGLITTTKLLDRETNPFFELEVVVESFNPSANSSDDFKIRSSLHRGCTTTVKDVGLCKDTVKVIVNVLDVNDNAPKFYSDRLVYFVPENSQSGTVIGEVRAVDADAGENAIIDYNIVGGIDAGSFSLLPKSGGAAELILAKPDMDFESDKKSYSIIIRAASGPLRTDVEVDIHVTDVNDNPPVMSDFFVIFNNYNSSFPFDVIGRVPAFDADIADKLSYRITSGNNANILYLNEATGEIKLSPNLNTNVPTRATFQVTVSDGINEATAQCHLIICDCNYDKGFDASCNKTTPSVCSCQANYYQPPDADACYPCDCYNVGSFSKKCDLETGQCRCRPGVLGRRCDSCASPFAEVTLKGCEVIYDGCPRAFSEGIWFERTHFGQTTSAACPELSVGFANRTCEDKTGWTEPDLFGCMSNTFYDLQSQLQYFERNEDALNPLSSMKLICDVRDAFNWTKRIYGRDLHVAFKIIHLLLNHETNQNGFNLTHKQDRNFIPLIIEATSSILDTIHVDSWSRIRKVYDEDPETLIKLFKSYLETLIRNREDTFTQPLEVSSPNIVFGIDTISTDQLWEMAYLEAFANGSNTNAMTAASPALDFSMKDVGVSVSLPKYNNYPPSKIFRDDVTRILLPLKIISVPTALEVLDFHHQDHFLHLPTNVSQLGKTTRHPAVTGYAVFHSLSYFLPDSFDYISVRNGDTFPTRANTPILLSVVVSANGTDISNIIDKHAPRISYRMRVLNERGHSNPRCAYWTFDNESSTGTGRVKGRWSGKGCEVKGVYRSSRLLSSYQYVNCSCDRVAPVAVLMDVTPTQALFQEDPQQSLVSYLGLTLSISILLITLFILTVIVGRSTNSNDIHRNVVLCLLMVNILFLIALKFKDELVDKEFPCKMVAILLHFFHISIFSWMLVEGIHLHRMIAEIRDINHGPMNFYYFLGYAIPSVVVGLSVGVKADQYRNYFFCWMSITESTMWSMVGPISLLATLNVLVFISALCSSTEVKGAVSDFGNLKTLLWLNIVLLPLLGLNCMSALLTVNDYFDGIYILYYIPAVVTSIYVFVGYCLDNRRVRFSIKITYWKLRGKNVSSHVMDESLSVTRVSRASMFNSPFEIHRPAPSIGVTSTSTTSRSTTTKGSSYDEQHHHKHRHRKKRHHRRRHHRHHYKNSSYSDSNPSLDLASSHSSDEDDGTSTNANPNQNEINSLIQRNLAAETSGDGEQQDVSQQEIYSPASHTLNLSTSPYGVLGGIVGVIPSESTPRTYTRSSSLMPMTFVEGAANDGSMFGHHPLMGEGIYVQRLGPLSHPVDGSSSMSYLPSYQDVIDRTSRRLSVTQEEEMTDEVDDEEGIINREGREVKDQDERELPSGSAATDRGTISIEEVEGEEETSVSVKDGERDEESTRREESSIIDANTLIPPLTSTDV